VIAPHQELVGVPNSAHLVNAEEPNPFNAFFGARLLPETASPVARPPGTR
jgi:hypothetical protein